MFMTRILRTHYTLTTPQRREANSNKTLTMVLHNYQLSPNNCYNKSNQVKMTIESSICLLLVPRMPCNIADIFLPGHQMLLATNLGATRFCPLHAYLSANGTEKQHMFLRQCRSVITRPNKWQTNENYRKESSLLQEKAN